MFRILLELCRYNAAFERSKRIDRMLKAEVEESTREIKLLLLGKLNLLRNDVRHFVKEPRCYLGTSNIQLRVSLDSFYHLYEGIDWCRTCDAQHAVLENPSFPLL